MRYNLALILAILLCAFAFQQHVYAQKTVDLKASVGRYHFSASGIVSPYASVVMTSQNIFLSSTVADSKGRFTLPRALINDGFKEFCLEATDIRRIGDSYTCFKTELPTGDFSKDDIFLAPTVGLSGRKITPDSSIMASGYTMPGSSVSVNLGNDYFIQAKADSNGYYKTEIKDIHEGSYELYAGAYYENKNSIKPTRTLKIESLGWLAGKGKWILIIVLILALILIIIPLIILWKRRHKKGNRGRSNRFRKIFFWRA